MGGKVLGAAISVEKYLKILFNALLNEFIQAQRFRVDERFL